MSSYKCGKDGMSTLSDARGEEKCTLKTKIRHLANVAKIFVK